MSPVAVDLLRTRALFQPDDLMQFRVDNANGYFIEDYYTSTGSHQSRNPTSTTDVTALAPSGWVMPSETFGAITAPRQAQLMHGAGSPLGIGPVLFYHETYDGSYHDHVTVWDGANGSLYSFVETRTTSGSYDTTAMGTCAWLSPNVWFARVSIVQGTPPSVTVTLYKRSSVLASESSTASRIVPSGYFDGSAAKAQVNGVVTIVSGGGLVGVKVSLTEYDSGDVYIGDIRYYVTFAGGTTLSTEGVISTLTINGGLASSAGSPIDAGGASGGSSGLVGIGSNFVVSNIWPTTGSFASSKTGFFHVSPMPSGASAISVDKASTVTVKTRVIVASTTSPGASPDSDFEPDLDLDSRSSPWWFALNSF